MVATPTTRWIPSSKVNPCPVCGRTKDGDCRTSADGKAVICHKHTDLKPGIDVVNGWAFTSNTSDGRAGHFVIDKPRETAQPDLRKVVPLRRRPTPAPINGPITLALVSQINGKNNSSDADYWRQQVHSVAQASLFRWLKPDEWAKKVKQFGYRPQRYYYGGTHLWVERIEPPGKKGKTFRAFHEGERGPTAGAGPDPWPVYNDALATANGTAGLWLLEVEGEKSADWAVLGGVVAISQPGHAHKVEQIVERYRDLQAAGVAGIAYLSDNDDEGERRAHQAVEAAAEVQLPLLVLRASEVWPDLPVGGSIDDAPGTAAERVSAITAAITARSETLLRAEQKPTLDDLLGPVEEGKLRRPRTDKLTQAIALVLPLQYNLLTNRIERDGDPIHGDYLSGLYLELAEDHAIDVAKERAIDAAMRVARQNAYHPVQDYLNGITEQLTAEEWAALDLHCFGGEDPSGWGVIHLQRQLIGLVARALRPGSELHTCLVLQSDQQGIGKSTFWKLLGGEWFSDSLGDLRDVREDRLQLHSAWIHEWGEIDNVMGKRESETLKRFITTSRDDVRRPYGRGTEQLLRSCGLVGTTNRRDFIKDPTGNRRFPIIQVQSVNLEWVRENRDRIWGSAIAAYKAGQPWHYSAAEGRLVSAQAMEYAAADPLRDALESWLEDHPGVDEVPAVRILWDLQHDHPQYWERHQDKEFMRQVSLALTALGFGAVAGPRVRYLLPNGKRTDKARLWKRP